VTIRPASAVPGSCGVISEMPDPASASTESVHRQARHPGSQRLA
jgi:hypothetical protein